MADKIRVNIRKSEIPIIWIDTSIINHMTQLKHGLGKLDKLQKSRISKLYDLIHSAVSKGLLICPLAEQEAEVWIERNKWLDTIHSLSLGIETDALHTIQRTQERKFMSAYVRNEKYISLDYTDAFQSDPVSELRDILKQPFFVSVRHPILFGEEYQKMSKKRLYQAMEDQRIKNNEKNVQFKEQLEKELVGEFEALVALKMIFIENTNLDDYDLLNTTCGAIDCQQHLAYWEILTEKSNDYSGLINFFRSEYHKSMPFTNISYTIFAQLMTDRQPIRSGDTMDANHAATLLPFSDIFIIDKAMRTFLKKRNFDAQCNTIVCYIGDEKEIEEFFVNCEQVIQQLQWTRFSRSRSFNLVFKQHKHCN